MSHGTIVSRILLIFLLRFRRLFNTVHIDGVVSGYSTILHGALTRSVLSKRSDHDMGTHMSVVQG